MFMSKVMAPDMTFAGWWCMVLVLMIQSKSLPKRRKMDTSTGCGNPILPVLLAFGTRLQFFPVHNVSEQPWVCELAETSGKAVSQRVWYGEPFSAEGEVKLVRHYDLTIPVVLWLFNDFMLISCIVSTTPMFAACCVICPWDMLHLNCNPQNRNFKKQIW